MKLSKIQKARIIRCQDCPCVFDSKGKMKCDQAQLLCRNIVLCNEWAESEMGDGTRFIVEVGKNKYKRLIGREEG